jgi:4-diphosphocytidyl-2-C-methyl-D-erythritol kinase
VIRAVRETAYAKLNLALHVRKRREDGYHELETLFAFVDAGDELIAESSLRDELIMLGEFGRQLDDPFGNIIAKALSALPHGAGWKVTLEKNLPVAAGLGGGSADAGAIFRMVERAHGLPANWREIAVSLGADVPACVLSQACIGTGTGTELAAIDNDLAGMPVLLVNPRVPLATGPVFKAWSGVDKGPMPQGSMREIALKGRNDLQPGAIALVPVIDDVIERIGSSGALVARMSGSGATCFGLFETAEGRDHALAEIAQGQPGWWTLAGRLR